VDEAEVATLQLLSNDPAAALIELVNQTPVPRLSVLVGGRVRGLLLEDQSVNVRKLAADLLALVRDRQAVPLLLSLVERNRGDFPEEDWYAFVRALGAIGDPQATETLCNHLSIKHGRRPKAITYAALRALTQIGDARALPRICAILDELTEGDFLPPRPDVDDLLAAFARFGTVAVPYLCHQLAGSNLRGKRVALYALERHATPESFTDVDEKGLRALRQALGDSDPDIRQRTAGLLAKTGRKDCLPALKARLRPLFGERDGRVRTAVQNSIAELER
jgi:HEAT repeat protein